MDSDAIVPHGDTPDRPLPAHVVVVRGMDMVIEEIQQIIYRIRNLDTLDFVAGISV